MISHAWFGVRPLQFSDIFLYFTDAPVYNISSTIFNVIQGQTFDLELDLDANPFPQNAMWFFNGQPLPVIGGIELGVNFIRIQMVTQLDSGTYTVQASNAVGTGMISFMLQVEGIGPTGTYLPHTTHTIIYHPYNSQCG